MNKSICFLVNGNQKIGLGHVHRCIALANKFRLKNHKVFFIFKENKIVEELLNINKCEYFGLGDFEWNNPTECQDLFGKILSSIDIVIIDLLENEFVKFNFLSKLNKIIVSITSFYFSEKIRYEDISFFPGFEEKSKNYIENIEKRTELYSGPKYLIFREEFDKNFKKEFNEITPNILVTMGGLDSFNFTSVAIRALLKLDINYKAVILISDKAKTYKQVLELASLSDKINIITKTDNISELMFNSTIAIINGGLTRYELGLVGTPFIALSVHKIQYEITERFTSLCGGVNLGIVSDLQEKEITESIKKLLSNKERIISISNKSQMIIDNHGADRILDSILDYKI